MNEIKQLPRDYSFVTIEKDVGTLIGAKKTTLKWITILNPGL